MNTKVNGRKYYSYRYCHPSIAPPHGVSRELQCVLLVTEAMSFTLRTALARERESLGYFECENVGS